ncbi:phosphotransferase [Herbiconiux sp. KACC 21604]|uniref:S-methyl-5-thioribose kinase n=1 Tax=unclassified Herbiconiux TaxID=2618217 RepID=UPI001491F548|nr:phosphotransferase [Herbiconiux sp. SALV-R1]QJU52274.1 phosphotransferase [Herbiconiux sp. SALV-R1]WPO87122.1 phosphotransferase [Herbiconiux sp. KACC 21604]
MTDFTQLTIDTVAAYLGSRPALAGRLDASRLDSVREVGDGNLNLVFIVTDVDGASVVLKQSLPHVRTDPSWAMTRERSAREATVLGAHVEADPEHVPAFYDFDAEHYVLAIENLSDHQVWRNELNEGRVHAYAADELGRYVARTAFATSPLGLDPLEHKRLAARAINPELAQITEDLVFTEPYIEHEHNAVLPGNEPDVAALRADRALVREMGLAKLRFMTTAQSLIHGDLHTGSVFVRDAAAPGGAHGSRGDDGGADARGGDGADARGSGRSVRAFDSEFGFVGPTGFDLGALWANFILAAARATALGERERAELVMSLPGRLWAAFEAEYRALWPTRLDPRVWGDEVLEQLLASIRDDAAVFAAAKAIRRIVGFAKASDIETLAPAARELAARGVLHAARNLALTRHGIDSVDALAAESLAALRSVAAAG